MAGNKNCGVADVTRNDTYSAHGARGTTRRRYRQTQYINRRTRLYHAYSEMELLWFGARVADRRHEAPRKIFRSRRSATAEKYEVPGLKGAIRLWLDNGHPLHQWTSEALGARI